MSEMSILQPAGDEPMAVVTPAEEPPLLKPAPPLPNQQPHPFWVAACAVFGWTWRIMFGAWLCFNLPVLSYFTSILVVGWLNRWMRARVLNAWWRQSRAPGKGDDPLAAGLPHPRPRWILPEKGRWVPALWLNLKEGFVTLMCVNLVIGWGAVLMLFSWEMGWLNSINRGYEQAWIGPTVGLLGSLLFIFGMIYLPLARAHLAVTGEVRSFFEVGVIWKLIKARLVFFTGYMLLVLLVALPLEWLKFAPVYMNDMEPYYSATDQQKKEMFYQYLAGCAYWLFLALLLLHGLAARLYRSALMKALRQGTVTADDLSPRLVACLDKLELLPEPKQEKTTLGVVLRWTWEWYYRRILYTALLLIGIGFITKVYVSEFLNYHPFAGFMNHPLFQFPCVDYYPQHLVEPPN